MPTQFEYPETGWSTGKMRKQASPAEVITEGARALGEQSAPIATMERLAKSRKKAQGIDQYPQLSQEQWAAWNQHYPAGQMIDKTHPDLEKVADTHDLYTIPDRQYEGFLFMNPKQRTE